MNTEIRIITVCYVIHYYCSDDTIIIILKVQILNVNRVLDFTFTYRSHFRDVPRLCSYERATS